MNRIILFIGAALSAFLPLAGLLIGVSHFFPDSVVDAFFGFFAIPAFSIIWGVHVLKTHVSAETSSSHVGVSVEA